MKYAVPMSGGMLSAHFGHCEQFALITVDEGKKQIFETELVTPPAHEPGLFPVWLAGLGVSFVIAGGMGPRAVDIFTENRIGVILGALESDPEKAVLNHLNGSLATGENACDHGTNDCNH
ncbi:MAG: ATPase [Chloroflexi bacterium]|nr:ATPase [Chloroflexota bacterium]MBT7080502.1 ATPase [Chloroflexota bacterium]MBT7288941.1 ATPase [Chloroflexota bacterium]